MEQLRTEIEGHKLWLAGLPKFPRVFIRDSFISLLLNPDLVMLKSHLEFAILKQGKVNNKRTGEEPGKIFHEYPGFEMNGLSTEYNACDTTALFLIAFEKYLSLSQDYSLLEKHRHSVELAAEYILNHLTNYIFYEDPAFCGADRFALDCTYWKDGQFIGRQRAVYPVCYPLVHFQNMRGLFCAASMLGMNDLLEAAMRMRANSSKLFSEADGGYYLIYDDKGGVFACNSDSLHILYYLKKGDVSDGIVQLIAASSDKLASKYGYRTLDPEFGFRLKAKSYDYYNTVWPFEQALILAAAERFSLLRVKDISSRAFIKLQSFPEYLLLKGDGAVNGGCDPQLWTWAGKNFWQRLNRTKEK